MAIKEGLSDLTPHEAAQAVGVGVQSIRRWCEWHAAHLNPMASPGPGLARRLTPRDVEVLKAVKAYRYQGLQTDVINEQLQGLSFAEIDNQVDSETNTVAPMELPASPQQAQAMLAVLETVNAVQRRLETVEAAGKVSQQNRRDAIYLIAIGIVIGLLFAVGMILLAWVYGGR